MMRVAFSYFCVFYFLRMAQKCTERVYSYKFPFLTSQRSIPKFFALQNHFFPNYLRFQSHFHVFVGLYKKSLSSDSLF